MEMLKAKSRSASYLVNSSSFIELVM